jgi:ankyrin repeat protein
MYKYIYTLILCIIHNISVLYTLYIIMYNRSFSKLTEGSVAITEALNRNIMMYQQTNQQHDANPAEIDIHEECRNQCRSSIILTYIDQHPESLAIADKHGRLPLHILLNNRSSSIDIALMMIEKYPAALQHKDNFGDLPLLIECRDRRRSSIILACIEQHPESLRLPLLMGRRYQCRSSIILTYIKQHPESLAIAHKHGLLPLHILLENKSSSIDIALMMIEKYPAALQHKDNFGDLPLLIECRNQCRSFIISQCIALYPEALAIADRNGYLPLHWLLHNQSSSVEDALMMIEKYPAALEHQSKVGLPLHMECRYKCRSSIISLCIELYPEALAIAGHGYLPLHLLLHNQSSSVKDALIMIEKYPAALEHQSKLGLPLHIECKHRRRSSIMSKCLELYSEALAIAGHGYLPLHWLIRNQSSSVEDALMMIEKYPAALEHQTKEGCLPLHVECSYQCRSSIISQCIALYPEALALADGHGYLPLHLLLLSNSSSVEDALMMIEKYPAALEHQPKQGYLPLHIECRNRRRSSIKSKCLELYSEALAIADGAGYLPLHSHLLGWDWEASSVEVALMMIEKYPAALQHRNNFVDLPLHIECKYRCRSSIISQCIELYPEALAIADRLGHLPLHRLILSKWSSVEDALVMIEKYPAALQHRDKQGSLPLHLEVLRICYGQCRSCRPSIIMRCIELFPESVDDDIINLIFDKINEHNYAHCMHGGSGYKSVVTMVFTIHPMSLYRRRASKINDIRTNPDYRRQILNLLPRHVFTPRHELDYRDLNWQPRATMMMLLSQMKIQQHTSSYRNMVATAALSQLSIMEDDENSFSSSSNKLHNRFRFVVRTISWVPAKPSRMKEDYDDVSVSSSISEWDQQQNLLLRIIQASTLLLNLGVNEGIAMSSDASYGICQHEDLGDILLRTILGFL